MAYIGLDFDGVFADCRNARSGAAALQDLNYSTPAGRLVLMQKLAKTIMPIAGVHEYVAKLRKDGHKLKIVTASPADSRPIIAGWLQNERIEQMEMALVGNSSKRGFCRGMDIYADDDLAVLKELKGIVPKRFLFTLDYNAHERVPEGVTRVSGWEEFYKEVRKLS